MNLFPSCLIGVRSASAKAVLCGLLGLGLASTARAGDAASGAISSQALGGGEFDYTIKLTNTGSNNLETFWFGWVPGEDFMPVSPTNIISPANWTANITGGGANDGFAIQWLTSGSTPPAPLTPDSTLTFSFDSTATLAQLEANSVFHTTEPDLTAFVYSGAPFSDGGDQFVVAAAPEPSSLALGLVAAAVMGGLGYWRAQGRQQSAVWRHFIWNKVGPV
jgi:hypothetical protein